MSDPAQIVCDICGKPVDIKPDGKPKVVHGECAMEELRPVREAIAKEKAEGKLG
jgi:hypothetical protein